MKNTIRPYYSTTLPAADVLAKIAAGEGSARVVTALRVTLIDTKCVARFAKGGHWLLRDASDPSGSKAYRLRSGNGSVYLLPGQLEVNF